MTNTRVAMHASDKVSVFIWTTCSHTTQVRLLPPASNPYRCFATPLCCSCKGPTGAAPHDFAMAKKQAQLLQKELKVLFKDTDAYMRTKVSQPDSRPSSHGLAALGIAVMVLVFGAIISADVMSLVCKSYRKPKPSKAKTKGKGSRKDKVEMTKVSTILP